jgi:hypothetical protein
MNGLQVKVQVLSCGIAFVNHLNISKLSLARYCNKSQEEKGDFGN